MKICSRCKFPKEDTEFSKDRYVSTRLNRYCRACCSEQQKLRRAKNPQKALEHSRKYMRENREKMRLLSKKWKAANPDKVLNQHLKLSYGLSLEARNKLLAEQGGKCAICEKPMTKPHTDHCHKTKKVRGLLCNFCNHGLGQFKDSTKFLRAAVIYLEKQTNV